MCGVKREIGAQTSPTMLMIEGKGAPEVVGKVRDRKKHCDGKQKRVDPAGEPGGGGWLSDG